MTTYPTNEIHSIETLTPNSKIITTYYKHGAVMLENVYQNGIIRKTHYTPDGTEQEIYFIKDGALSGEYKKTTTTHTEHRIYTSDNENLYERIPNEVTHEEAFMHCLEKQHVPFICTFTA